jgi:uncharacterized membrane protein (DUF485 family)
VIAHIKAAAFTLYVALVLLAAFAARWIGDIPPAWQFVVAGLLLSALFACVTRLLMATYELALEWSERD